MPSIIFIGMYVMYRLHGRYLEVAVLLVIIQSYPEIHLSLKGFFFQTSL